MLMTDEQDKHLLNKIQPYAVPQLTVSNSCTKVGPAWYRSLVAKLMAIRRVPPTLPTALKARCLVRALRRLVQGCWGGRIGKILVVTVRPFKVP